MIRVLLATIGVLVMCEAAVILPRPHVTIVVAAVAWMMVPGMVLARRFLATDASGIASYCIGPALGLGFSVFGTFLLWAAGLQNWLALVLGPALTWATVALVHRCGGAAIRLCVFDRRDLVAVVLLLTIVPAVTWAPYDHVREPVTEGEAYRAYFTADFLWAMTVASELAKGDVPPANPFLKGTPMHYYWLSHFLSGALYRNVQSWGLTIEQVLLITGLLSGLAAVAFLYCLARLTGASAVFAAVAVAILFLANSYEGADRLWALFESGQPLNLVRHYNIDAVTRWFYAGMPVDGLHRMLLYQPHHWTGYLLALAALWLVGFAEDITETSVPLGAGVLVALSLLFSSFTALVIGCATIVLYAVRLFRDRALSALWKCAALYGAPVVLALGITMLLGYTDRAMSLFVFGWNPVALLGWPSMLTLSFGPLLILGVVGVLRVGWVLGNGAAPVILLCTALACYFLVDVVNQDGVWVGWRTGHLVFIALAVVAGNALTAAWSYRIVRLPLVLAMAATIVPAVPTVVIDVYNAQDIQNREQGPGFPWTTIITPSEREAMEWIRRSTPARAVVQFEPDEREALERIQSSGVERESRDDPRTLRTWGWVTAFAERRMAAGVVGAMIPLRPYREASARVRQGVFRAQSPEDAHRAAAQLEIDYLVIGEIERRLYPTVVSQMCGRPDLFPHAFQNDAVTILAVGR